jgi:hypothetical protein
MTRSSRFTRRLVLGAALGLLAAGCSDPVGPGTGAVIELARARAKWREQQLTAYSYDFRRSCFCLETTTAPVRLLVVGEDVTEVAALEGWYVPPSLDPGFYPTVDELFDVVETAIRERVTHLEVEYDNTFGYPRLVEIDRAEDTVDDELTLWAENLVSHRESPLEGRGH